LTRAETVMATDGGIVAARPFGWTDDRPAERIGPWIGQLLSLSSWL
jgi:hypothetical protein